MAVWPSSRYKAGPRIMPMIIGTGGPLNVEAWKALETWGERWLQNISSRVSGTVGQPHATIKGAAHYLQDEKGKN